MKASHEQGTGMPFLPGRLLCALSVVLASATCVQAQTFPPDNIAVGLDATVDEAELGGRIPYRLRILDSNIADFQIEITGQISRPGFTRLASGLSCQSSFQVCTGFQSACTATGCSFSLLLRGTEQVEIGYAARVRDDVPEDVAEIFAEAVVSFPEFKTARPRTVSATTPIFRSPPDLGVEVSDGDVVAMPGGLLGYRIEYSNLGQLSADDAQLTGTVPEHASFDPEHSDAWTCAPDDLAGSECRLAVGSVGAGESGLTRFAVEIDPELPADVAGIVFSLEITMSANGGVDPDPSNNVATERTRVLHDPGIPVPEDPGEEPGLLSVLGDQPAQRVGRTVSGAGDLDGDGLADALVGAPGSDTVFVVLGRSLADDLEVIPASTFPTPDTNGYVVQATDGFGGLGDRLAGLGDVNGDGLGDFAYADATVALSPLTGRERGAFLTPGFDRSTAGIMAPDNRFAPEDGPILEPRGAAGPFATEVAGVGDVNADGLNDFALRYISVVDGFQRQTVFVLFGDGGPTAFQPETIVVEDAVSAAGVRLTDAGFPEGRFGETVTGIGDFNGDGIDDFAIGAPGRSNGSVFVVFGSPGLGGSDADHLDAATLDGSNGFALTAGPDESGFGAQVAAAGDFNGDSFDDLLVAIDPAADTPGRVYVVFGTPLSMPPALTPGESSLLASALIDGAAPNDLFGRSMDSAGDLNGDGFDDLLIGAPGLAAAFEPGIPASGSGRVFVIFGSDGSNGSPGDTSVAGLVPDGAFSLSPPVPASGFGTSVAGLGDFDGDGVPDYLVAAPNLNNEALGNAGQVWFVSGRLRPETAPNLDIVDFSVAPEVVFVGETVTLSWIATPDDSMTSCAGSGLPDTGWNGAGKPASGIEQVDTSNLAPGIHFASLACERDDSSVQAEVALEVLEAPTTLALSGAQFEFAFFGDVFVQLDVRNTGEVDAEEVLVDLVAPSGYQAVDVFRFAASCASGSPDSEGGPGDVSCDPESIPDWQCEPVTDGFACGLAVLPADGIASLVMQLRGQGQTQLSGSAAALNAAPVSFLIPVGN